jgi:hypothetical protein
VIPARAVETPSLFVKANAPADEDLSGSPGLPDHRGGWQHLA